MIEHLKGLHETVYYKDNANILVYHNTNFEEYPPHWHTPLEIIMPVENHYIIECGGQKHFLKEGEIILISPGVLHRLPAVAGQRYIIQAELSPLYSVKGTESVLTFIAPALVITPEAFPDIYSHIRQLILEIIHEYFHPSSFYEALIFSRLLEILVCVRRSPALSPGHFDTSVGRQREYLEKFTGICAYIDEHCTENLSLEQTASLCGFSKYHFSRLFKQFTNVTFYRYLNQKRILHAQQLLADPSVSITEAALSCGFSSLSAFIRMFKIIKGCTPSQFRSLYKEY